MITQKPNGRYEARIFDRGKQVTMATFRLKREAMEWEAAQKLALTTGTWANPKDRKITLGEVIEKFNRHRRGRIGAHAWDTDESNLRLHVPDAMKRRQIRLISSHDLNIIFGDMLAAKSRKTVSRHRDSLSSLFEYARNEKHVDVNPAVDSRVPPGSGEQEDSVRPFTPIELKSFLAAARQRSVEYADMAEFLARTAIRWGEARDLRVGDVRSSPIWQISIDKSHSDRYASKGTKTERSRFVPLDDRAREIAEHYAGKRAPEEYLFRSSRGHQVRGRTLVRELEWKKLTTHRLNDLRHTGITNWIHAGLDVKTVSIWAGHANSAITHRVYIGWFGTSADIAGIEKLRAHQEREMRELDL